MPTSTAKELAATGEVTGGNAVIRAEVALGLGLGLASITGSTATPVPEPALPVLLAATTASLPAPATPAEPPPPQADRQKAVTKTLNTTEPYRTPRAGLMNMGMQMWRAAAHEATGDQRCPRKAGQWNQAQPQEPHSWGCRRCRPALEHCADAKPRPHHSDAAAGPQRRRKGYRNQLAGQRLVMRLKQHCVADACGVKPVSVSKTASERRLNDGAVALVCSLHIQKNSPGPA